MLQMSAMATYDGSFEYVIADDNTGEVAVIVKAWPDQCRWTVGDMDLDTFEAAEQRFTTIGMVEQSYHDPEAYQCLPDGFGLWLGDYTFEGAVLALLERQRGLTGRVY